MPERGAHHMLNGPLFPIGEHHFCLFLAYAAALAADRAYVFRTFARCLPTNGTWFRGRRRLCASARLIAALLAGLRLQRLAVPFGVAEVKIGLHEVIDGEVVLAIVKACVAADDLLELDHGVDRPHRNDVANIAGINAGRELLRGGKDEGKEKTVAEQTLKGKRILVEYP